MCVRWCPCHTSISSAIMQSWSAKRVSKAGFGVGVAMMGSSTPQQPCGHVSLSAKREAPPLSSYSLSFSFCYSNSCLLVDASMRRGSKQINGLDPHDMYCHIRAGDRMFIDLSKLQSRRMNIHSVRFSQKAPSVRIERIASTLERSRRTCDFFRIARMHLPTIHVCPLLRHHSC